MPTSKTNRYLSTFLFFLIIVGFPLVTTLLLPNYTGYVHNTAESDITVTRMVTVPYRAFVLGISLIVIALHWNRRIFLSLPIRLYLLFWFLLSIRMFYDLLIRTDVKVDPSIVQNQFTYSYLACLIPAIAVLRSRRSIDFELGFKWIVGGYVLLAIALSYNNPLLFSMDNIDFRLCGNIALGSIQLGVAGAVMAMIGICWLTRSSQIWQKTMSVLLTVAGVFVLLRAGSRGPLVAFVGAFVFFLVARQKSPVKVTLLLCVSVGLLFAVSGFLLESISRISPHLADRFSLSGNVNQYVVLSNHRNELYGEALNKFMNHPVIGDSYALFLPNGGIIYSHNMVLDAFMGLGFFGGVLFVIILSFAVRNSFLMIYRRESRYWIGALCICYIITRMFSGCIYQAGELNALLVIVLSLL